MPHFGLSGLRVRVRVVAGRDAGRGGHVRGIVHVDRPRDVQFPAVGQFDGLDFVAVRVHDLAVFGHMVGACRVGCGFHGAVGVLAGHGERGAVLQCDVLARRVSERDGHVERRTAVFRSDMVDGCAGHVHFGERAVGCEAHVLQVAVVQRERVIGVVRMHGDTSRNLVGRFAGRVGLVAGLRIVHEVERFAFDLAAPRVGARVGLVDLHSPLV